MAREADRLRLLHELGTAFAARTELDELMPLIVERCRTVLDCEGVAVLLHAPETDEFYFPYTASDPSVAAELATLRFPADRGIAGDVFRSGRAERVDDVSKDPRFWPGVDRRTGAVTRNLLAAPLTTARGSIGVLEVINHRDGDFSDDDLALLEALGGSVAVALENARLWEELRASEERLRAQVVALQRDLARRDRVVEIVGTTPAMSEVFRLMESAAPASIAVLIEGETGTGKELVARGIHRASPRADGPFLAVNCAAFTETLLESELFGHRRGAFTGADRDRRGLFEAADGGTVFLDEVGEMPFSMQAKLLRVLQEGEVTPIGDVRPRKVNVRVLSATNRDLSGEVARGAFRQDLFYRLAAFPIRLPPLRERRDDIPLLAQHILAAAAERQGKFIAGFSPEVLGRLVQHDWPGNVRELQNEIERAVVVARPGEAIQPEHLSPRLRSGGIRPEPALPSPAGDGNAVTASLRSARAAFERGYIAEALRAHGGNVSHTARALGLSRVMLQKKMKDYGLR
jgi:transcriptional regulator with GAF, ATPase, and Fis domain